MVEFAVNSMPSNDDFSFIAGQAFRHSATVVRIVQTFGDSLVLEHHLTGEKKTVPLTRLLQEYRTGSLLPCDPDEMTAASQSDFNPDAAIAQELNIPLNDLSKATISTGLKYIRYIRALMNLGHPCLRPTTLLTLDYERLVRQAKDESAPKISTLYNCSLRIKAADGDWRAAFPNYKDRGGKGQYRWNDLAELAYKRVIDTFNNDRKLVIRPVTAETKLSTELRKSVPPPQLFSIMPSRSSIERRLLDTFGAYEIYLRKYGKAAADEKFRDWYPRDRAVMALEVLEFDDKDSRCFLYDQVTGLPCGRGYVTAGVDQYSAAPMGFSISDLHRNVISAKQAFLNAVLPFDQSDPSYQGVQSLPAFFGRPGIAIFDNALYNHAKELELFVMEISRNTLVAWSKPRTPTEKSIIEDFNGRMADGCFSTLPGFGGPKETVTLLSKGQEECCMTIQDFRKHLVEWSYNTYCNRPRDGYSPLERWQSGMRHVTPRLPKLINAAFLATTLSNQKQLRPEGLQLLRGLSYQSQELLLLRRHIGHNAKVKFRYDPFRLDSIWVLDPRTSKYIPVPSTKPEYAKNRSLYQHRLILKWNAERGRKHPALNDLLNGIEALQDMVAQLRNSKKRRERVMGKKLANEVADSEMVEPEGVSRLKLPATEIVTDLEATIGEIEDVELEADEDDWSFSL